MEQIILQLFEPHEGLRLEIRRGHAVEAGGVAEPAHGAPSFLCPRGSKTPMEKACKMMAK
jgi:hypothetical protein